MVKHKQLANFQRSPSFSEALYFMLDSMLRIDKFYIQLKTQLLFFTVATL
jgi:hypothetical protein